MGLQLCNSDDMIDFISDKLRGDFVLISGNNMLISILENQIYTPGTPKNRDFIAGFMPSFPELLTIVYLGKKTPELKELLKRNGLTDIEWDNLFEINFKQNGKNKALTEVSSIDPKDREEQIENIAKWLKSKIRGGDNSEDMG